MINYNHEFGYQITDTSTLNPLHILVEKQAPLDVGMIFSIQAQEHNFTILTINNRAHSNPTKQEQTKLLATFQTIKQQLLQGESPQETIKMLNKLNE